MITLLEPWIGEIVGTLHIHRIPQKELAKEIGVHEKYLCGVLGGKRKIPVGFEARCRNALSNLVARTKED